MLTQAHNPAQTSRPHGLPDSRRDTEPPVAHTHTEGQDVGTAAEHVVITELDKRLRHAYAQSTPKTLLALVRLKLMVYTLPRSGTQGQRTPSQHMSNPYRAQRRVQKASSTRQCQVRCAEPCFRRATIHANPLCTGCRLTAHPKVNAQERHALINAAKRCQQPQQRPVREANPKVFGLDVSSSHRR